ncbi:DUF1223 domain-containing protein [Shewanella sp. JM162201]|uniref:DUF1223 domain-containing protein n=1 Tax=Shewanella jiangmenensis TaxID=2837387 RepID=A0ABS5V6D3_9GAMM|nr:DUF1223 domain-containing protein [Shewanella jiangmenensis]MBT1445382.1 DUF1223 domain-containing protein [Shewanella jiangmenensis]
MLFPMALLLMLAAIPLPRAAALEFQRQSDNKAPVIIELYTSQGCSSCPPAEAWLSEFAGQPALWQRYFPLAFHVSYWDYLGWKDPFADSRFGKRQYAHWNQKHSKGVYTPQIFITGKEWRGGEVSVLNEAVAARLALSISDDKLSADYEGKAATLNVALVGVGIRTQVARGENRGKLLAQDFAVLSLQRFENQTPNAAQSRFGGEFTLKISAFSQVAPRLALVAWTEQDMRPLQAVGGWLQP